MLPALLLGGAALGGSAINAWSQGQTNSSNREMMREQNQFNAAQANRQMEFQTRMSNSAYQRSVEDMRKAGVNPMLAFSQGGASAPQGSSASGSAARMESQQWGDALSKTVSTALEATRLKKDIESADSSIALNKAAEAAKQSEIALNNASAKNVLTNARIGDKTVETMEAKLPAIKSEAQTAKRQADIDNKMIIYDNSAKRVGEGVGIISNAIRSFNPLQGLFGGGKTPPSSPAKRMREEQFLRKMEQQRKQYGLD